MGNTTLVLYLQLFFDLHTMLIKVVVRLKVRCLVGSLFHGTTLSYLLLIRNTWRSVITNVKLRVKNVFYSRAWQTKI
jgi:hypothetical protein